jgi:hypothetical protein
MQAQSVNSEKPALAGFITFCFIFADGMRIEIFCELH